MELKPGYKQTEVGVIPQDWDVKKVKDFTDGTAGGTPSTSISAYWGGDIPWMSSGELHLKNVYDVEERITEEGLKNSSTKLIPANCILIGLAGQGKTRGTVAVNRIPLCTNQSIAAIFPNENFVTEYLFYNLENRYDELRSLSTGDGGRGGLNLTILRNFKLSFPTKEEQTAIAGALSDADGLIAALERLIAKKRQIKQGAIQTLLNPNDENGHLKAGWVVKTLRECLLEAPDYGLNAPAHSFSYSLPKYLRITDITEDGKYSSANCVSVKHPLSKEFYLQKGDLVFARTGASVGKTYLYDTKDGELVFAGFLIRVRPNNNVLCSKYLKYFTQSNAYKNWITVNSMRSGQPGINGNEYAALIISIPANISEQTHIATILSDMDAEIDALETKLAKAREVKQGMMQNLLSGRIRLV